MADFLPAFERALLAEGGYKLHQVAGDTGGLTYAGIARAKNPQWPGWAWIDRGETPPSQLVRDFYRAGWWLPIRGDEIRDQSVAESIYSFGTNAGLKTAVRLAQIVAGVTPDGAMGGKTVEAINAMEARLFLALYALARIARYRDIVARDRTQARFLLGWINRTLSEAATS
ncbi:N-acetylmuramidase [Malikia spinosa]|uniref:N-acetylmuramidase n=1 Tax=Malikia spinosa TaxID=86180 RepID=A0A2S9KEB1_9BURK|nr:putative peptidoglycan-binding domain-containing protein [Malikia spinosa]PRD68789.1 N-acetylmuramidase [Malikia spinosa]